MKYYQDILRALPKERYIYIEHEWGQTGVSVYNQIVSVWPRVPEGGSIFLFTRKAYGLKSMLTVIRKQGLHPVVVWKGEGDIRLVHLVKDNSDDLVPITEGRTATFFFAGKEYIVHIDDAIFSKNGLDEGTRFLLDTFLQSVRGIHNTTMIGDLGAGWGAISLILATEFPYATILAYEKEVGSYAACQKNVATYPNIILVQEDVTDTTAPSVRESYGKCDYIVSNFSFHVNARDREQFFETVHKLLRPNGEIFFVTEGRFVSRFEDTAKMFLDITDVRTCKRYTVFRARKK